MIQITTGASRITVGGILNIWVGDNDSGKAGNVDITGGLNLDWNGESDGGEVNNVSGSAALSGRLTLQTVPGRLCSDSVQ